VLRRFDRYLLMEILGPLGLGFLVYTFILLFQKLFQSAEMIIRRGVDASTVGELLLLSLPYIVVLTIPMSLLFGILTAIGRLSSDSELVALRAGGVSLMQLYRPIALISLVLTLLSSALMIFVQPWGNSRLEQLGHEILRQSVAKIIQPRYFHDEWKDKTLYVFEQAPNDDRWHGVFLASTESVSVSKVTTAEWGELTVDESGEKLSLHLTNAYSYTVNLNDATRTQVQKSGDLVVVLDDAFTSRQNNANRNASKGVRAMQLAELLRVARDPRQDSQWRNLAKVEIHKKFSIPAACLVFGLFALPLGFSNRRGSKASGFALSIGVIMVYWLMINNFEEAARVGRLAPWFAMWLPNFALILPGLFILGRRNRDKSLMISRFDRWIREDVWRGLLRISHWRKARQDSRRAQRTSAATEREPGVRLRLPQLRLRFPNLLDRYILRVFAGIMSMVLLSVLTLYIVADLSNRLDDVFKNDVSFGTLLVFYRHFSLQIIYDLAPLVLLISTLITFGILSRSNEVTAAKALGISLYRLSLPVVIGGLAVALSGVYLQSSVLPISNHRMQQIEDEINGREARTFRRPHPWLYGQGGFFYNTLHYDKKRMNLQRLQVFEIDEQNGYSIRRRLFATNARFDPTLDQGQGRWVMSDGWTLSLNGLETLSQEFFVGEALLDSTEKPEFFETELRAPSQMPYRELRQYISELNASGQDVPDLEVQLHNKFAFPFVSLVMVLVGLPFAFRLGKQGALYGIGLSIVLGMIFFAILALFTALGQTGVLPPAVAVWSPGILFAMTSVYLFLGVRT